MQDGFQPAPRIIIGEYDLPHGGAVEFAILVEHVVAKFVTNIFQCWLSCGDNLARNHVCVNYRYAEVCEQIGDSGLTACDAAGQTDTQRRVAGYMSWSAHLKGEIDVEDLDLFTPEHRDPACRREVRSERYGYLPVPSTKNNQRDSNQCTDNGRHHYDQR